MRVAAIYGPPGTGKTHELVNLAHDHVGKGDKVMYLSYTRAAASEATSRINGIEPSTIHSFAFRSLGLSRASVVDIPKLRNFSELTGIPFRKLDEDPQEGDEYMSVLSYARNAMPLDPDGLFKAYEKLGEPGTRDRFLQFTDAYFHWKKTYGYVDFDDMLKQSLERAPTNRKVADVVCLDEAQDCTPLQWLVFSRIVANVDHVYLAGDDDQAIYEWSGADPHGMEMFRQEYLGEQLVLHQSYRVPELVWSLANSVADQIDKRVQKQWSGRSGLGVVDRWSEIEDVLADSIIMDTGGLILVRDRFRLAEVKKMLNREMIPYDVWGGHSPWTSREANDLKAKRITLNDVSPVWYSFYREANLNLPIKHHLSTIHQAKGKEHDTVALDLTLPTRVLAEYDANPDAERRVQYVGITRARSRLILCGANPVVW